MEYIESPATERRRVCPTELPRAPECRAPQYIGVHIPALCEILVERGDRVAQCFGADDFSKPSETDAVDDLEATMRRYRQGPFCATSPRTHRGRCPLVDVELQQSAWIGVRATSAHHDWRRHATLSRQLGRR